MTTGNNIKNVDAAAAILAAQAGQGTAAVTPTTEQELILTRDGNVCFFYGTLMVPAVLTRVLYGTSKADDTSLKIRPAILKGWQRRRVRNADYPGITPCAGASVRGTLVEGITDSGLRRLDTFEGSEYTLKRVQVRVVEQEAGQETLAEVTNVAGSETEIEVTALTYVYTAGESRLEDAVWDFKHFVQERLHLWAGGSKEYADVDALEWLNDEEIVSESGGEVAVAKREEGLQI